MKQIAFFNGRTAMALLLIGCATACEKQDTPPDSAPTPYVTRVVEFRPAVGQFTNLLPEYEPGDTQETMNRRRSKRSGTTTGA